MRRALCLSPLLVLVGCGEPAIDLAPDMGPTEVVDPAPSPVRPSPPVVEPDPAPVDDGSPTGSIPAGTVLLGSRPGSSGRVASAEADLIAVEVPAFTIDRRPYPNDRERAPMTGVDQAQAAELCASEGKRLCSEIEWERACKGDGDRRFPGGPTHDPEAMSPFGVRGLGQTLGEWTSSPDVRGLASGTAGAVVFRGAAADQEPALHRCGARRATSPTTRSRHLTFRCCQGPELDATYPNERSTPRVRRLEQTAETIRAHLRTVPEVASFADGFHPASDETMTRAVGDLALLHGWELAGSALQWTPVDGEEIWVYSGKVEDRAAVIALFRTADDRLLHGASLLFDPEEGPVAVAFTPPERRFLQISTDWARTAAGAVLTYRDDATLTFDPR